MIWVVVVEAVAICVLGLVVVALTHSYAGLAARVEPPAPTPGTGGATEPSVHELDLVAPRTASVPLPDLDGVTPGGERVLLALVGAARDTLLAFLSPSCASCRALWDEMSSAVAGGRFDLVRIVVVSKGPERESPSELAALAARAGGADVVMSSQAWADAAVPGSPYFALVSRHTGGVLGEGTARTWAQVAGLIEVASADERLGSRARKSRRDRRQEVDVDRVLLEAGVLPGDPSLYPVPHE